MRQLLDGTSTNLTNYQRNLTIQQIANPNLEPDDLKKWLITNFKTYGVEKVAVFKNSIFRVNMEENGDDHLQYHENLVMGGSFVIMENAEANRQYFLTDKETGHQKTALIEKDIQENGLIKLKFSNKNIKFNNYNSLMSHESDFYSKFGIPFLLQIQEYKGPIGLNENNFEIIINTFNTEGQIPSANDNNANRDAVRRMFQTAFNMTNKCLIAGLNIRKLFHGQNISEKKIKAILTSIDRNYLNEQVAGIIKPEYLVMTLIDHFKEVTDQIPNIDNMTYELLRYY